MNCVLFAKMDQGFSLKKKKNKNKTSTKYWKMEKILQKSGTFARPEKWEP